MKNSEHTSSGAANSWGSAGAEALAQRLFWDYRGYLSMLAPGIIAIHSTQREGMVVIVDGSVFDPNAIPNVNDFLAPTVALPPAIYVFSDYQQRAAIFVSYPWLAKRYYAEVKPLGWKDFDDYFSDVVNTLATFRPRNFPKIQFAPLSAGSAPKPAKTVQKED